VETDVREGTRIKKQSLRIGELCCARRHKLDRWSEPALNFGGFQVYSGHLVDNWPKRNTNGKRKKIGTIRAKDERQKKGR